MPTATEKRREQRLREVLKVISERREFRRQEVAFLCSVAKPQFVSRVLNQLAAEGILYAAKRADDQVFFWAEEPEKFSAERWIERQLSGAQVTKLPVDERPRERLLESGTERLTVSDLFAILIRSGTSKESAVQAGQRLAKHFDGRLETIVGMSKQELSDLSQAVNVSAYCSIMAGIELGRRIELLNTSKQVRPKINSTTAAVEFCAQHFARLANDAKQEEFHIVTLDTKLQVIHSHQVTVGTLDASLVHPREVFRQAIRDAASSILLVHNHPSGDPTPSRQDRDVTERLRNAGELLGVQVIDHVIVAKGQAVSLADHPG
jgi:DNA repair protein RadC